METWKNWKNLQTLAVKPIDSKSHTDFARQGVDQMGNHLLKVAQGR